MTSPANIKKLIVDRYPVSSQSSFVRQETRRLAGGLFYENTNSALIFQMKLLLNTLKDHTPSPEELDDFEGKCKLICTWNFEILTEFESIFKSLNTNGELTKIFYQTYENVVKSNGIKNFFQHNNIIDCNIKTGINNNI